MSRIIRLHSFVPNDNTNFFVCQPGSKVKMFFNNREDMAVYFSRTITTICQYIKNGRTPQGYKVGRYIKPFMTVQQNKKLIEVMSREDSVELPDVISDLIMQYTNDEIAAKMERVLIELMDHRYINTVYIPPEDMAMFESFGTLKSNFENRRCEFLTDHYIEGSYNNGLKRWLGCTDLHSFYRYGNDDGNGAFTFYDRFGERLLNGESHEEYGYAFGFDSYSYRHTFWMFCPRDTVWMLLHHPDRYVHPDDYQDFIDRRLGGLEAFR